jgi:hypothetical protein
MAVSVLRWIQMYTWQCLYWGGFKCTHGSVCIEVDSNVRWQCLYWGGFKCTHGSVLIEVDSNAHMLMWHVSNAAEWWCPVEGDSCFDTHPLMEVSWYYLTSWQLPLHQYKQLTMTISTMGKLPDYVDAVWKRRNHHFQGWEVMPALSLRRSNRHLFCHFYKIRRRMSNCPLFRQYSRNYRWTSL